VNSGAVARPREVQKVTPLDQSLSGTLMPGMSTDMRDPPADALRSDLFESRAVVRILLEKFQQEIAEQRDVIQQLRQNALAQKAEIDHLKSLLIRYVPPAQFQPEPFTSRTPYNAESWWQKFQGYSELPDVEESVYRSLLRLLLEPKSTLQNNSTQDAYRPPIKCFFCDKVGHIKRDCFKFQATLNTNTQRYGNRNNRSSNGNFHDNRGRSKFRVTFTDENARSNDINDNDNRLTRNNYSRNDYNLGPRFNRGRSSSCDRHRGNSRDGCYDRGRFLWSFFYAYF
jgi:hypothetical protein